ncbi:MAG: zinc ribbon domain-containing protein, partial [Succinivibrionaceae bacterium]|nr:zinc ribbon domain-containing protein [Succinivibrionaceae bacterium]
MTYCVKCGAKADDGDIFCRSCGAKIVRSAAGSSHGPAVSSPRTDGAAVTDKKENSNEGKTQETELGTEQKPAADRGAPSEEGGVSAGQAGGAVPKEHQGRG